jgi:hypothetical protein
MSPIVDLLKLMRQRPANFIGRNSISRLAWFLRGYHQATEEFRVTNDDQFLIDFGAWVRNRFNVTMSRSWEDIISFHSLNEDEAMQLFWELFDEYVAANSDKTANEEPT